MARRKAISLMQDTGFHRQCEWDDHGVRCDMPGHMAQTTLGAGPWYCFKHFAKLLGWLSRSEAVHKSNVSRESGKNLTP